MLTMQLALWHMALLAVLPAGQAGFASIATHGSRSSLLVMPGSNLSGSPHIFPFASNGVKRMEFMYAQMDVSLLR